jgi:WD40 repeat protein
VDAWDLKTQEQVVAFAGGAQNVISIAVSPTQIALGLKDKIEILNESGEKVLDVNSPGDHALLAFSADGSMLASSNSAGFIEIWKLGNGTFAAVGSVRKDFVYSMVFNPIGTQLAVGTTNTVYLIDSATVKEMARLPLSVKASGLSYSSDGNMLATASLKVVQFWDVKKVQSLNSDNLVNAACSRLTANFSEAQWNNLFPNERYRLLCEGLPVP